MDSEDSVIIVGSAEQPEYKQAVACLNRAGLEVEEAHGPTDLPSLLRRHRRTTIVVYDSSSSERAEEVLAQVARLGRTTPVVVVVDSASFGSYHQLMQRGACGYYELAEGPDLIAHAVSHFARVRAA